MTVAEDHAQTIRQGWHPPTDPRRPPQRYAQPAASHQGAPANPSPSPSIPLPQPQTRPLGRAPTDSGRPAPAAAGKERPAGTCQHATAAPPAIQIIWAAVCSDPGCGRGSPPPPTAERSPPVARKIGESNATDSSSGMARWGIEWRGNSVSGAFRDTIPFVATRLWRAAARFYWLLVPRTSANAATIAVPPPEWLWAKATRRHNVAPVATIFTRK